MITDLEGKSEWLRLSIAAWSYSINIPGYETVAEWVYYQHQQYMHHSETITGYDGVVQIAPLQSHTCIAGSMLWKLLNIIYELDHYLICHPKPSCACYKLFYRSLDTCTQTHTHTHTHTHTYLCVRKVQLFGIHKPWPRCERDTWLVSSRSASCCTLQSRTWQGRSLPQTGCHQPWRQSWLQQQW